MAHFVAFLLAVLLLVPALLVAIPVHELGHAIAAYLLGDRSVRYFGWLTPNPRRYLDPLGVIAVFVALVGWGKRVTVQQNRIRSMGQRLVFELAGPAANLLVAVVLGQAVRFLIHARAPFSLDLSVGLLDEALFVIVFLNLSIFAFQLLPVPGLDGWRVIEAIFRDRNPRFFFDVQARRMQIWIGAVIVMFLWQLLQGGSLLSFVMVPFFFPASLISIGQCVGYGVPGFIGLQPCPP